MHPGDGNDRKAAIFPSGPIYLNKARWGKDGGPEGKETSLARQQRGVPFPPAIEQFNFEMLKKHVIVQP